MINESNLENPIIDDILLDFDLDFGDHYTHNDIGIPRVSHILSSCRDQEALISWASRIPESLYRNIKKKATTVGTEVHHKIENYMNFLFGISKIEDIDNLEVVNDSYQEEIDIAYCNFKDWYNSFTNNGFIIEELVGLEIEVTCPWFGGTVDGIVKINGLYYIIDFKTSKSISWQYLLQVAAYMWIINNGYAIGLPHIDGVGIIRIDKRYNGYEDLFMNVYNPHQAYMLNQYQMCFCSYVDTYYRTKYTDKLSSNYYNDYDIYNIGVKNE